MENTPKRIQVSSPLHREGHEQRDVSQAPWICHGYLECKRFGAEAVFQCVHTAPRAPAKIRAPLPRCCSRDTVTEGLIRHPHSQLPGYILLLLIMRGCVLPSPLSQTSSNITGHALLPSSTLVLSLSLPVEH